jgi:hypothetical protein
MDGVLVKGKRVLVLDPSELHTIEQALQYTLSNEGRGNVGQRAGDLLRKIKRDKES